MDSLDCTLNTIHSLKQLNVFMTCLYVFLWKFLLKFLFSVLLNFAEMSKLEDIDHEVRGKQQKAKNNWKKENKKVFPWLSFSAFCVYNISKFQFHIYSITLGERTVSQRWKWGSLVFTWKLSCPYNLKNFSICNE